MKPFLMLPRLLCCITSLMCLSAHAALRLDINVVSLNTPKEETKTPPTDVQQALTVTLAPNFISVDSPGQTTILDFKTRRRLVLDTATKTYVDYSLYDTVGFRAIELKNRETLNSALNAANISQASNNIADNENSLSLLTQTPAKIDAHQKGGNREFTSGGQLLAQWSEKGLPVGPADMAHFVQFLRYYQGGHPTILNTLASAKSIPQQITFIFTDAWGSHRHALTVTQKHTVPDSTYDLSGYTPYTLHQSADTTDAVNAILDNAARLGPEDLAATETIHHDSVARAMQEGQPLDALLAALEWSLMTGEPVTMLTPEQLTQVKADPAVKEFLHALDARDNEAYADAINTLVDLRSKAPTKAYVLKIFEANDRSQLHQMAAASKLYIDVLQHNIMLSGVYRDFGDLNLRQFDTPRAWRCWDIGRKLAPKLPAFEQTTRMEKTLLADHPEYF